MFFGGDFGKLCRKRGIKQEFTPADSLKYNGSRVSISTDQRHCPCRSHSSASTVPARASLPVFVGCSGVLGVPRPKPHRNHSKSWGLVPIRDVLRFASPPEEVWPFLKPAICMVNGANKSQLKVQDCYYVGPSVDHPRDYMLVLITHRSILTPRNVTWQHVPSASPAPPHQLPLIAKEGEFTAGEGAGGEGGPRVEPRHEGGVAPCATRNTRGSSGRIWSRGRGGAASPRHHRSPPGVTILVASTAAVAAPAVAAAPAATLAAPAATAAIATTAGTFLRLWGDPRDLKICGELPTLQSGRTRSQSRGLTMSASCADAMLAYALRTVEAKRTEEEEATEIERAHGSLLEERLEKERKWLKELERHGAQ